MSASVDIVQKAMEFGFHAHSGQLDDSGNDYFTVHCWQVFSVIELLYEFDDELQAAALLHDTLEDTDVTYEDLVREFGVGVADLVNEVTHERTADGEGWYFPRLSSVRGYVLKFADRASNLSRMEDVWDEEKIKKYMKKSVFWQQEDK